MSFSLSVTAVHPDIESAVADAAARYDLSGNDAPDETRQVLDGVAKLAADAAEVAHIQPGDTVAISISGHANPGHAPREGWANNTVTVSVTTIAN